jgi:transcriptional regulator with XRE-family HTH domain
MLAFSTNFYMNSRARIADRPVHGTDHDGRLVGGVVDQVAFGRFVRRAVDEAKNRRGWSVSRLAAETGVGRSTLFRWLSGDCQQYPELETLRGFCAALEIPVGAAFVALGLRGGPPADETEAATRADIDRIMLRLADPAVSQAEKVLIRDMLSYLARPTGGQVVA